MHVGGAKSLGHTYYSRPSRHYSIVDAFQNCRKLPPTKNVDLVGSVSRPVPLHFPRNRISPECHYPSHAHRSAGAVAKALNKILDSSSTVYRFICTYVATITNR